jgi:hypothetical protein
MTERYAYKPPLGFDIRVKPDAAGRPVEEPQPRPCGWPGCREVGEFRAPRSRDNLREFQWFCLAHVRRYNQSWNYFEGLSEADQARFCEDIVTGHRPTWSMGVNPQGRMAEERARSFRPGMDRPQRNAAPWADDLYDLLGRGFPKGSDPGRPPRPVSRLQREALTALGLDEAASLNDIKARYKELVKRFHPDANGGDRGAEESFRRVIKAYQTLRTSGWK